MGSDPGDNKVVIMTNFQLSNTQHLHYNDVIMRAMVSQITSLATVYSTVYSRRRSKKISKLRVTGLRVGNSPVPGEFRAQMASNAENVSIWWRHHVLTFTCTGPINEELAIAFSTRPISFAFFTVLLGTCYQIQRRKTLKIGPMQLFNIPQYTIDMLQNSALWDMEQLHCGICEMSLFGAMETHLDNVRHIQGRWNLSIGIWQHCLCLCLELGHHRASSDFGNDASDICYFMPFWFIVFVKICAHYLMLIIISNKKNKRPLITT